MTSLMDASKVHTTTAGLSTIVDLKPRKGGNEFVESLSLRDRTIYFNKQRTASISCISKETAEFVHELMKENFEMLKNRTLDETVSLLRLPADYDSLRQMETYVKQKKQSVKKFSGKIERLKEQLDNKVAEIYGLGEEFSIIQNAFKIIGGEIQEKAI